jgi:hypothetical protein
MKKLVTKLRKGPVPQKPDSPESMQSLFAEAGEDYQAPEPKEPDEEEQIRPGQPAMTPQRVGGSYLKPKLKKPLA